MGRNSCSVKQKLRKGLWSPEEDEKLYNYITRFGVGCWSSVPKLAGLQRCGKSCRLRWINYLRPDLKRGTFSQEEEDLILSLHEALGNRWAQIATHLPGRTDNEIKNFWNSCLKKKLIKQGIDPNTHKPMTETQLKIEKDSSMDSDNTSQQILSNPNPNPNSQTTTHPNTIFCTDNEGLMHNTFVGKQVYDPIFLSEFQTSLNGYGLDFLYSPNPVIDPGCGFDSMPYLANSDHHPNMMDTDYSDGSGSKMSYPSTFSWSNENKMETVIEYDRFSGIQIDEKKPCVWQLQSLGDYSCNNGCSLTSLSEELSGGGNLDTVFHQI